MNLNKDNTDINLLSKINIFKREEFTKKLSIINKNDNMKNIYEKYR